MSPNTGTVGSGLILSRVGLKAHRSQLSLWGVGQEEIIQPTDLSRLVECLLSGFTFNSIEYNAWRWTTLKRFGDLAVGSNYLLPIFFV